MTEGNTVPRILIIVNSLAMGGAERISLEVAQLLYEAGCEIDFVILESATKSYPTNQYKFNIHVLPRIPRPLGYIYPLKALQVKNYLKSEKKSFDLVISNLFMADYVSKYLRLGNTYHCIHNSLSQSLKLNDGESINLTWAKRYLIYKFFARKVYQDSNIITVSQGVKDDFLKLGFQPRNIKTIYNPMDCNRVNNLAMQKSDVNGSYIIHVGRFDRQKRHDILIKAYAESKIQDMLVLVGDNDNQIGKDARRLVSDLGLERRVIFYGLAPDPYPLIKNARALILTSDFEGLPTVMLEALALETPVISTDCPSGPKEILEGTLASGLVPVGDIHGLAAKMQSIPSYASIDFQKIYKNLVRNVLFEGISPLLTKAYNKHLNFTYESVVSFVYVYFLIINQSAHQILGSPWGITICVSAAIIITKILSNRKIKSYSTISSPIL